jgi:hypothetical protein
MAEAEKALLDLQSDDDEKAKKADTYVKIMRKVASEGEAFAAAETERIKKVLEGKLSPAKKAQMEQRINILKSFIPPKPAKKEEL